jgi:hypothetical protein
MPKRSVRILILAMLGVAPLQGQAAEQNRGNNKAATQQTPPPTGQSQPQPTAQPAKFTPVNRDVCDKHPNLKQCA